MDQQHSSEVQSINNRQQPITRRQVFNSGSAGAVFNCLFLVGPAWAGIAWFLLLPQAMVLMESGSVVQQSFISRILGKTHTEKFASTFLPLRFLRCSIGWRAY